MSDELEFTEDQFKDFFEYHKKNPSIYEKFKEVTFQAITKGFKHYGSKGIFEQIRWLRGGDLKEDGFKVNNLYTPTYARLFEKDHPEHKGFFRKRKLSKSA